MPTSLVSTGVQFPDSTIQTTASTGGGANIQSFTATGTYTKPPGAKFVYVELWGGGGGGQAGYSLMNPPGGCTGGTAYGGGGGSGGGYTYRMFAAPVVGATETVTIGAGGAGGTAATAPCPSGPGGFGTNGGTTNFGTLLFAGGGTICGGGAVVAGSLSYRQNIVAPGPGFAYTASVAQIQIIGGPASSIPFTPLANLSQCYTKREIGGMWSGGGGGITRCPSSLVPTPGPFYPEVGKGRNSMFGAGGGGGGATKAGGNCPSITLTSGGTGGAGRIYGTNAASTSVSTGGSGGPSPGGAGSAGSCFNGGGGGASAVITPSITTAGAGGAGGAGGGGGGGGGGAVAPFTPPGTKRAGAGGAGGNGLAVVYTW